MSLRHSGTERRQVSRSIRRPPLALAVRGVGAAPRIQRIHVEVVAIDAEAELVDALREQRGQPAAGGRIAQFEEPALRAAEDELRVFARHLGAGGDPLGLEPHHELEPEPAAGLADRLEAVGEGLGFAEPVAHAIREPALEPGGVKP